MKAKKLASQAALSCNFADIVRFFAAVLNVLKKLVELFYDRSLILGASAELPSLILVYAHALDRCPADKAGGHPVDG